MAGVKPVQLVDPSSLFRPEEVVRETNWNFRNYKKDAENLKMKRVFDTYKAMHQNQTVEYVQSRQKHWCRFNTWKYSLMEALDKLDEFIDESDPDTSLPNIVHAFQTAERVRKDHPDLDWFHLTGLIHDLGKLMAFTGEPQWSTVGDTYPVGCEFAKSIVYRDSTFEGNPDIDNEKFNSKLGQYNSNCGLSNVTMTWGHDEYLFRVLKENNTTLPEEGLYIIRFHSFYPYHTGGEYSHLADNYDSEMLPWLKEFNKFDLYTKQEAVPDIEELKPYYETLIAKYMPGELRW